LKPHLSLRTGEWIVLAGSVLIAAFAVLVGVLIYLKPPPSEFVYLETEKTRAGEAIYRREACGSCHRIHSNGPTYGPALDGEGSRRSREWLLDYLRNPRAGVGEKPYRLAMPSFAHLPETDLEALAAYLEAFKKR
jgi:cbb3-type cytochrome oxidase cytochrome c subunit